jgi:cell division protein FtsX
MAVFVAWPFVVAAMAVCVTIALAAMVIAWPLIPFGHFTKKDDDDGYRISFPWDK